MALHRPQIPSKLHGSNNGTAQVEKKNLMLGGGKMKGRWFRKDPSPSEFLPPPSVSRC